MANANNRNNNAKGRARQRRPDERNREDAEFTPTEPNSHFCSSYWSRGHGSETALQRKPGHRYSWVSPTLSETVYSMLAMELLSPERLQSERFPLFPALFRYGLVLQYSEQTPLLPPKRNKQSAGNKYAALVLDCEMVGLDNGQSDLVRVAVVDFMTGKVLLNALVQPVGRVVQWRTRVTGVQPSTLRAAKADPNATVLRGWPEARTRIFQLADEDTIFIGHALCNDMKVLRIAAERVVDSLVLTAQAAFGISVKTFPRTWSLKSTCQDLMNIDIQKRNAAHDPLEDTLATRELVIWCLTHHAALLAWGYDERTAYEEMVTVRRAIRLAEARLKAEEEARKKAEEEAGDNETSLPEGSADGGVESDGSEAGGVVIV